MSEQIISVYNAYPKKDKNRLKIKFTGHTKVSNVDKLKDHTIKRIMISDNIFGTYFKPNISQNYLLNTNKIPVIYLKVDYMRSLIRRPLMSVWLFFTADKSEYRNKSKLDSEFKGTYTIEVEVDGDSEVYTMLKTFTNKDSVMEKMKEIVSTEDSLELYKFMIDEIDKKRKKEGQSYNFATEIPKVTITAERLERIRNGEETL